LKVGKIENSDLLVMHIQKKALCDLEYGSDSIESIIAGVQLGGM
jgi:hypothetical protein